MKTTKYNYIGLGFDVTADFRGMNRILKSHERRMQFIKSESMFLLPEDEQVIRCNDFDNDLKLWLMQSENTYFVFLNCGIRRYDDYLSNLNAYDSVRYDISYPILEIFDNEDDAIALYNKIESFLSQIRITESICKKYNAKYISEISSNDYNYSRKVDTFENVIYVFNKSQKLAIFLQKMNCKFGNFYIFVNRKIKIAFDTIEDRDACWDYLTNFYEKFNMTKIDGISTQLFLTDFLSELMENAEEVDKCQKVEGKISWLKCIFNGYDIFFRLISRNGRYWGKSFEFEIYKYENFKRVYDGQRFETEYLKEMMQELFAEEDFMQKYFSC